MLDQVYVNQSNGNIYLGEIRPDEGGRGAIVEFASSGARDVLPKNYNALTQVQEYGGGSFVVSPANGHIIFSDFDSKTVFDMDLGTGEVKPIVEDDAKMYFADFDCHPVDSNWVLALQENHHASKIEDIETTLVAVDSATKTVHVVAKGADFYAFPRFSPDGRQVCWTQWNHPNMPWNYTELWLADWSAGQISNQQVVAGRETKASVTQPQWGRDGSLFFVDDRTGYWQLYQKQGGEVRHIHVKGLEQAEFASPDWFLGASTYAPLTQEKMIAFYNMDGAKRGIVIDIETGAYTDPGFPIIDMDLNALKRTSDSSFALIGATATAPKSFFHLDITKPSELNVLKASTKVTFSDEFFARAHNIKFPRTRTQGGGFANALYFPPTSPDFHGSEGSLPPLIVSPHGGPTAQVMPGVYMRDQFWTTRGYALVQVNYVGSSGFGKEYMDGLEFLWGVGDIEDTVSCVDYLISEGLADPKRVGITGHSSGGYATMQALAMYPEVWGAGISESGISDMQAMFDETHKFESQYLQPLCFPEDTSPVERKRIIQERSPIHFTDRIKAPLLILSGADDNVVPPNQAHLMADKIRASGQSPVEVKVYEGEGHIFSKASTLKDMEVRREAWFRKYLVGE